MLLEQTAVEKVATSQFTTGCKREGVDKNYGEKSQVSSLTSQVLRLKLKRPHHRRDYREQTHLVGVVLHREAAQVAVLGGDGGLEEDQERVLTVIDIVDGEVEPCFELGGLLDGPVHGDVKPVVGLTRYSLRSLNSVTTEPI